MSQIKLRITRKLYNQVVEDLLRPHEFASERVGFIFSDSIMDQQGNVTICFNSYNPVIDEDYINDPSVGARFGQNPINESIGFGLENNKGVFHVHMHEFSASIPQFSDVDIKCTSPIAESCSRIIKTEVHGLLLIGKGKMNAIAWLPGHKDPVQVDQIIIIDSPLVLSFPKSPLKKCLLERYNRQSFLGKHSEAIFNRIKIGVVGLGGGGSHIVQQLAHIGIKNYALFDHDHIDESNLNRLIGGTLQDVKLNAKKFDIATRMINNLHSDAKILGGAQKWESLACELQSCDVVFGCVDSLTARRDLEAECRRFLIPYIDIGMGIDRTVGKAPHIYGQVHLSIPGSSCLICRGFLNQDELAIEATRYGEKGGRPQVVWSNGVLASTAVGILAGLLTGWKQESDSNLHKTYDGNNHEMADSIYRMGYPSSCEHYNLNETGPIKL